MTQRLKLISNVYSNCFYDFILKIILGSYVKQFLKIYKTFLGNITLCGHQVKMYSKNNINTVYPHQLANVLKKKFYTF